MFMGEYNHSIDDKGRVILPAKFREGLGENFVITKGLDECLFVYPQEEWRKLEDKLTSLSIMRKDTRKLTRFFMASSATLEFDKQGRINIPQTLKTYAELKKDVVVIGVANRVEIWDKTKWEISISEYENNMDEVAENLADLDFSF